MKNGIESFQTSLHRFHTDEQLFIVRVDQGAVEVNDVRMMIVTDASHRSQIGVNHRRVDVVAIFVHRDSLRRRTSSSFQHFSEEQQTLHAKTTDG